MNGDIEPVTLDIVGSSTFGRDPKVLASRTFNMIIADGWFQDYMGYENVLEVSPSIGRGIFVSIPSKKLITVYGNRVYSITILNMPNGTKTYLKQFVAQIDSSSGDVFIDENNTNQIAICDKHDLYIYNYLTNVFQKATLPAGVIPGYVTYQNGFFLIVDILTSRWFICSPGDGLNWFWGAGGTPVNGAIQTKPDLGMAILRVPGRGSLLYVMGRTVTEFWTGIPALFPYQKSQTINVDYGILNAATLAQSDNVVAWLGSNEKSGPVIMYTTGSDIKQISTDGINFKFTQLVEPEKSSAFFVKLSGHLIYQFTFYGDQDNYTLLYDFTEGKFYDATDENMNYHIARKVAFFDNNYYFVSFNDGNLYEMRSDLTTFNYGEGRVKEIPRIRVCSNVRYPNQSRFVIRDVGMTMEQGNDQNNNGNDPAYHPRIGMSMSVNGGISFSSYVHKDIYPSGKRLNKLVWWNVGSANDFVPQFRFYGKGPWKATNGLTNIYS